MSDQLNPFETKREVTPDDLKSIKRLVEKAAGMAYGGGEKSEPSLSKVKDPVMKERLTMRVNDLLSVTDDDCLLVWFLAYKAMLDKYREIVQEQLPAIMDAVGVPSMTLDNGLTVKIVDDVKTSVSIKDTEKAKDEMIECELEAMYRDALSEDQGLDKKTFFDAYRKEVSDMVGARFKEQLIIDGPDEETKAALFEQHIPFSAKESIHHATLKSTIKDMMARGVSLPETVNVFEFREAVIK